MSKTSSSTRRQSTSPKFDVHGYSGCPLQVLSAPSFSTVSKIVRIFHQQQKQESENHEICSAAATRTRYFVMKLSSSESYNARLKKQAEKQQFFHRELSTLPEILQTQADKKEEEPSSPSASSFYLHIPPILFTEKESTELVRSFLIDEESTKQFDQMIENENNDDKQQQAEQFIQSWKKNLFANNDEELQRDTNGNNHDNLLSAVIMPYVHHTDCLRFLCTADFTRIKRFEDHLCYFFEWQVKRCTMKPLPVDIIVAKLLDLKKVCSRPESLLKRLKINENDQQETMSEACVKILDKLLENLFEKQEIKDLEIPMGLCHGDLTLSNILVQESTNDKIVFIDFLDSFLESPLGDMCKINQDLAHGWTIRMLANNNDSSKNNKEDASSSSSSTVDPVRLFILFERMMKKIVLEPFGKEIWFQKLFRPLCVVSQMRVLQYSTDETVARYLWKTIEMETRLCDVKIWE